MISARTLLLALPLCLSALPAQAENYILFGQQPLAVATNKGSFASFSLGKQDARSGRTSVDTKLAARLKQVWRYNAKGEAEQLKAVIKQDNIGCDTGLVLATEGEAEQGLLSSKPITLRQPNLNKSSLEALHAQGAKLLATTLHKAKISKPWASRIMAKAMLTPAAIFPDGKTSLIITAYDEANEKSLRVLLIATPDLRGQYRVTLEEIRTGTAGDSDGYAGTVELVFHADLNGDGIEELLVRTSGYESFGTSLLQWNGKRWHEVASNGGGC